MKNRRALNHQGKFLKVTFGQIQNKKTKKKTKKKKTEQKISFIKNYKKQVEHIFYQNK